MTETALIRDAQEADLPRLLAIINQAIRETTAVWHVQETTLEARRGWLQDRQGAGRPVLVAVAGGVVQGFASYGDFRPFAGFAATVEHSVYVDPAAQGQGLGRQLLAALVARAVQDSSVHVMVAAIEAGNAASVALHRREGFVEAGVLKETGQKFGRWLDLLFMTRHV
ncbi:GNAT family N-acetyltransferase [Roseomonas sp. 18066]|uniref:GNAT family N-acetyltransferase n=1 Tax=Roseomonas sp. 18066 TaxID=2681412 RepID=UPI00135AB1D9|nr:GNAT family N-acetyltransferase [Roseomonas sp. 18066]